jgi:HPt (histidine-containing phosphotransfer) domain-containing protein
VTAEELRRRLDALGADYRDSLPGKVAAILGMWHDASSGVLPSASLNDLRRELHTLAGSARTFGVARVSELAAAAELLLEPCCEGGCLPEAASAAELTRLLDAM